MPDEDWTVVGMVGDSYWDSGSQEAPSGVWRSASAMQTAACNEQWQVIQTPTYRYATSGGYATTFQRPLRNSGRVSSMFLAYHDQSNYRDGTRGCSLTRFYCDSGELSTNLIAPPNQIDSVCLHLLYAGYGTHASSAIDRFETACTYVLNNRVLGEGDWMFVHPRFVAEVLSSSTMPQLPSRRERLANVDAVVMLRRDTVFAEARYVDAWWEVAVNVAAAVATSLKSFYDADNRCGDEFSGAEWATRFEAALNESSTSFDVVDALMESMAEEDSLVYCDYTGDEMRSWWPYVVHDGRCYMPSLFATTSVIICHECEDPITVDDGDPKYLEGYYYHQHCMPELFECEACGSRYRDEDRADRCCYIHPGTVQSYSYKPKPRFIGSVKPSAVRKLRSGLYLGLELEVECDDDGGWSPDEVAEAVYDSCGDRFYCKSDGSLDYGVEIVSHPMLLPEFARSGLPDAVAELRRNGCTAWNTRTAGMHIHMSRDAFDPAHAYKFMRFIYGNKTPLQALAGRKSRQWASFDIDDHHRWAHTYGTKGERNGARYLAVNPQNEATFELRFWRPSLQYSTIQSALEFCEAAHQYTNSALSVAQARRGEVSFDSFVRWLNEDDAFPVLRERVKARVGIDLDVEDI